MAIRIVDATIWFTTLSGGQLGVHCANCSVQSADWDKDPFKIFIKSTNKTIDLSSKDNEEALTHYDEIENELASGETF